MAKKLFPGVTEQDIQRQEKAKQKAAKEAEEKRIALEKAKQAAEEKAKKKKADKDLEAMAKDFYKKFGNKVSDVFAGAAAGLIASMAPHLMYLGVMYGIWLFGSVEPSVDAYGDPKGINPLEPAVSVTDWGEQGAWRNLANPLIETFSFSNIFNKEANDNFKKTFNNWNNRDLRVLRAYVGLVMVLVSALFSVVSAANMPLITVDDIKKILILWQKNDIESIKMEEFINEDIIGKIISHMSGKDAKVFNQMLNGEINVSYEVAVKIMEGHLKTHPEDLQMVFDFFDERSIPQEIKEKYGAGKTISFEAAAKLNEIKR